MWKMITALFYKMFIVFYPVKIVYCDLFHILLSVTHGSMECIYVHMYVLTLKHLSNHATKFFVMMQKALLSSICRQEVITCFMSASISNWLPARDPKR